MRSLVLITMAFTYNPSDSPDSITLIRSEIGDIYDTSQTANAGRGVKPFGECFTDAELSMFLSQEGGTGYEMRAVAHACEALATSWARMANTSVGPRSDSYSDIAKQYAAQAERLRAQYGGNVSSGDVDVVSPVIADGYHSQASDDSEM